MRISIARIAYQDQADLLGLVDKVNRIQQGFTISLIDESFSFDDKMRIINDPRDSLYPLGGAKTWEDKTDPDDLLVAYPLGHIHEILKHISEKYRITNIIGITSERLENNFFGHCYGDQSIITTKEWDRLFAPPSTEIYLEFELFRQAIIQATHMPCEGHREPKGCLLDSSPRKDDLKKSILAGKICDECIDALIKLGVDQILIRSAEAILGDVRDKTLSEIIT